MRFTRTWAVLAAAIGIVASVPALVPATSASAGASASADPAPGRGLTVDVGRYTGRSVTWVDGSGRQYLAANARTPMDVDSLVVARTNADGTPDGTWGSYVGADGVTVPGARLVEPVPPVAGARRLPIFAADDAGRLSILWVLGCTHTFDACTRWFARIDAAGATIGQPTEEVSPTDAVLAALEDGSWLTQQFGQPIRWRDGTGADRASFTDSGPVTATVTAGGSLLVSGELGRIRRFAPSATAPDLDVHLSCADTWRLPIGRSVVDEGFVVACPPSGDRPVTIERYRGDGTLAWSAEAPRTDPDGTMTSVLPRLLLDSEGRAWVPARAERTASPVGPAFILRPFTAAGPGPVAYQQTIPTSGPNEESTASAGIGQLRDAPGAAVALVDDRSCCGRYTQSDHATASVAMVGPVAEAAPTCHPGAAVSGTDGLVATVRVTTCAAGGSAASPRAYQIRRQVLPSSGEAWSKAATTSAAPGAAFETTVPVLPGRHVVLEVRAGNGAGVGPATTLDLVPPYRSVAAFVRWQYQDLTGSVPTSAVQAAAASAIRSSHEPLALTEDLLETGLAGQVVEPVARLYRSYFLRDADREGLAYWVGKRRSGTKLSAISDSFARSNEFKRRYGSLTNRVFVAELYDNVFGRPADPSGLDFWTRRLDAGRMTRGRVVLQFSESTEGVRRSASIVRPLAVTWLLLGHFPSMEQRVTWAAQPDPRRAAIDAVVSGAEYAGLAALR